jgi:hypothetical protein
MTAAGMKFCHACGRTIDRRAEICPLCGVRQPMSLPDEALGLAAHPVTGAPLLLQDNRHAGKSRVAAGVLAITLGVFGAHKFYLGRPWLGLLYLAFFWTGLPALVGLIEGIMLLVKSDSDFLLDGRYVG